MMNDKENMRVPTEGIRLLVPSVGRSRVPERVSLHSSVIVTKELLVEVNAGNSQDPVPKTYLKKRLQYPFKQWIQFEVIPDLAGA